MPNLTASIPHQLTRTEAKRRIQDQIAQLRGQYGTVLGSLQENWEGDTLHFAAGAMGQSIKGSVAVEDQAVQVNVELPWLLAQIAGGVKQQIEQQGRKLLSGPPTA